MTVMHPSVYVEPQNDQALVCSIPAHATLTVQVSMTATGVAAKKTGVLVVGWSHASPFAYTATAFHVPDTDVVAGRA